LVLFLFSEWQCTDKGKQLNDEKAEQDKEKSDRDCHRAAWRNSKGFIFIEPQC